VEVCVLASAARRLGSEAHSDVINVPCGDVTKYTTFVVNG
jgi:hypothetical protein